MKLLFKIAITGFLITGLTVSQFAPTYAQYARFKVGQEAEMLAYEKEQYHEFQTPGWLLCGNEYYYFDKGEQVDSGNLDVLNNVVYYETTNILKNTTTPDGYQVNEKGQWVVDGVVQHGNLGNNAVGTEEYKGKSMDDLWKLMAEKVKTIWQDSYPRYHTHALNTSWSNYGQWKEYLESDRNWVLDYRGLKSRFTTYDGKNAPIYLEMPKWVRDLDDDSMDSHLAKVDRVQNRVSLGTRANKAEKTLRAVLGDNEGKRLFDYIQSQVEAGVADKMTPNEFGMQMDKDGFDYIDFSAFKNSQTDYGLSYTITNRVGEKGIQIYIFE